MQIQSRYDTCLFKTQLQFYLYVYKEDLNLHSLFQSQKTKLVSRKVVTGQPIQKTFSMTLLATYSPAFLVGLVIYIRSLSIKFYEVPSISLSTWTVWLYQLHQIYLHLCVLFHCWSRTSPRKGRCTKTTNIMYKNATIGINFLGEKVLCISMSCCKSSKNVWA